MVEPQLQPVNPTQQPEAPQRVILPEKKVQTKKQGEILIGKVGWKAYRKVRDRFKALLSEHILQVAQDTLSDELVGTLQSKIAASIGKGKNFNWLNEDNVAVIAQLVKVLRDALPRVIRYLLTSFSNGLEEELILGCVGDQVVLIDELEASEVLELLEAVFQVNDFSRLLDTEKNWWREADQNLKGILGFSLASLIS